ERASACSHHAAIVEAGALIDDADLAGGWVNRRRHHLVMLGQQIHRASNELARRVRMRPVRAGTTQQRDDLAAVAVAIPNAQVLGVLVAIDDSAATTTIEENTESKSAHRGHGPKVLVDLDQRPGLGQRDRADLRAADIGGDRLRTFGRELFADDPLICLLWRLASSVLAPAIVLLSAASRAKAGVGAHAERNRLAACRAPSPMRQDAHDAGTLAPAGTAAGAGAGFRVGTGTQRPRAMQAPRRLHGVTPMGDGYVTAEANRITRARRAPTSALARCCLSRSRSPYVLSCSYRVGSSIAVALEAAHRQPSEKVVDFVEQPHGICRASGETCQRASIPTGSVGEACLVHDLGAAEQANAVSGGGPMRVRAMRGAFSVIAAPASACLLWTASMAPSGAGFIIVSSRGSD